MKGLGIDVCEIARIEKAIRDNENFLSRYFTAEERAYLTRRGNTAAQSAAAMFAAKEAVAKALGTGFSGGVMPWNISVVHDEKGAPAAELTGAAKERLEQIGGAGVRISLSHEGDSAIAFAVIGGF